MILPRSLRILQFSDLHENSRKDLQNDAKTYEQGSSKIFAENREALGQNFWNIEKEKDREKEKVGGRPAKLNEKKSHIEFEREIKKERGHYFFIGSTT